MRAVIDTNVLVSGLLWRGLPGKVLEVWNEGGFDLVLTPDTFQEYQSTLTEIVKRYASEIDVAEVLSSIAVKALWVEPLRLADQVCDDPDDDIFIAAALGGKAQYIVTGDKALLRIKGLGGFQILKPVQFLKLV